MSDQPITRRKLLGSTAAVGSGLLLSGCDMLNENEAFRGVLRSATDLNFAVHRSLGSRAALAREFPISERSPFFRGNGTQAPDNPAYQAASASDFAGWTLEARGLFDRPGRWTLDQLRAMPQRTQTTRHDCVEGWSAIGTWTGVPLHMLLDQAGIRRDARYIVFRCADVMGGGIPYYESIDMIDARHPQTIIAHRLNEEPLPVRNGAPLRLRVETQLGYKQAKYLQAIEAVANLEDIGQGKGGYWEDVANYAWYAGI